MHPASTTRQEVEPGLWELYKRSPSQDLREKLVLQYLPLVKFIVNRMFTHLPAHVSRDDLLNTGTIGLIKAVDRFDPALGNKFETYAIPRIKGAILDELRSYDLMPRSLRAKARELQHAIRDLEIVLGRYPDETEIAAKMGVDVAAYRELLSAISPVRFLSLSDSLNGEDGENVNITRMSKLVDSNNTVETAEGNEMKSILRTAIQKMPEKEKLLVALYYYEELTMKEISKVLKVTESRVSQMHTQAILRLRAQLQDVM